jgi:hypothetical protein
MNWRTMTSLCVLVGVLWTFSAVPAFASDPTCPQMTVQVDSALQTRWPELAESVRQAFESRNDVDMCARVELTSSERSIVIAVILPDGRSASRSVSRPEDVLPTLEALLLVPRAAATAAESALVAPAPSAPDPTPAAPDVLVTAERTPLDRPSGAVGPPSYPPSRLRIELAVVTEALVGDGQTGLGLGALSFLDLGGWLMGFEGRADRYQEIAGGPTGAAIELAVLCGRRFRFKSLALDLAAGPAIALRGSSNTSVTTPTGTTTSHSSEGPVPRAQLGTRLNFFARSRLRPFVGIEGDVGPPSAPGTAQPSNVSGLPVWTVGFALGATVGTQ